MRKAFLGFDTSNYRTSICILGEDGEILFEAKELLTVPEGKRGLRQSEAFFRHVNRLPEMMGNLGEAYHLLAVGASVRPRPVPGSYMPVFRAGESFGRVIASLYHIPFYAFSHQEGHIAAGEYALSAPFHPTRFLAVHLSGGTSELLDVTKEKETIGYRIEKMGGTLDLHAGQLIDRIGVEMGLPFPAGPALEEMAKGAKGSFRLPTYTSGYSFSFSGIEALLFRLLKEGNLPHEEIAFALLHGIAKTLEKTLRKAIQDTGIKEVLIVGGVSANHYIRERLRKRLSHPAVGVNLYFAPPEYSGDNAFGIASLVRSLHLHERNLNLRKET